MKTGEGVSLGSNRHAFFFYGHISKYSCWICSCMFPSCCVCHSHDHWSREPRNLFQIYAEGIVGRNGRASWHFETLASASKSSRDYECGSWPRWCFQAAIPDVSTVGSGEKLLSSPHVPKPFPIHRDDTMFSSIRYPNSASQSPSLPFLSLHICMSSCPQLCHPGFLAGLMKLRTKSHSCLIQSLQPVLQWRK